MKAVVMGGSGFVGSYLCDLLCADHAVDRVVNLDRKQPFDPPASQKYSYVQGDTRAALVEGVKPGNRKEDEPGPSEIWGVSRPNEFRLAERIAQEECI